MCQGIVGDSEQVKNINEYPLGNLLVAFLEWKLSKSRINRSLGQLHHLVENETSTALQI